MEVKIGLKGEGIDSFGGDDCWVEERDVWGWRINKNGIHNGSGADKPTLKKVANSNSSGNLRIKKASEESLAYKKHLSD